MHLYKSNANIVIFDDNGKRNLNIICLYGKYSLTLHNETALFRFRRCLHCQRCYRFILKQSRPKSTDNT